MKTNRQILPGAMVAVYRTETDTYDVGTVIRRYGEHADDMCRVSHGYTFLDSEGNMILRDYEFDDFYSFDRVVGTHDKKSCIYNYPDLVDVVFGDGKLSKGHLTDYVKLVVAQN